MYWNLRTDTSSLTWRTLDFKLTSKAFDTFLHGMKPEVTGKGCCGIKSFPVITYLYCDHSIRLI